MTSANRATILPIHGATKSCETCKGAFSGLNSMFMLDSAAFTKERICIDCLVNTFSATLRIEHEQQTLLIIDFIN